MIKALYLNPRTYNCHDHPMKDIKHMVLIKPGYGDVIGPLTYCDGCVYFWFIENRKTGNLSSICNCKNLTLIFTDKPHIANLCIDSRIVSVCKLTSNKQPVVGYDFDKLNCDHQRAEYKAYPKLLVSELINHNEVKIKTNIKVK
jgi:hypothetical protein